MVFIFVTFIPNRAIYQAKIVQNIDAYLQKYVVTK